MRLRYDEALKLQGIPCTYQYPIMPDANAQGESVIDHMSIPEDTFIFFDGNPKVKTLKRYGWVVENSDDLPFLIHCSFNLEHMQRDAVFTMAGLYTELGERKFRVTEITYDMQAPDHLICQVVPVYSDKSVGRTDEEVRRTFDKSSHFLKQDVDYRGKRFTRSDRDRLTKPPEPANGRLIGERNDSVLSVNKSNISLTRGDSAYLTLEIDVNNTGQRYSRQEGDSLVFTVKRSYDYSESILRKEIEGLTLILDPEDTEKMNYGEYWYDVQLTTKCGNVYRVICPSMLTIREVVTF